MAMALSHLINAPSFSTLPSSTSLKAFSPCSNISFHQATDPASRIRGTLHAGHVRSSRFFVEDDDEDSAASEACSFDEAVELFNQREYYKCHDSLEALWIRSEEPTRTLIHGILQCAVGFHHLFNSNHKGAMMELGEGLCKLRKMDLESGPFHRFEQEIAAVLDFVYKTQIELAACSDDMCLTMDQSERSYQLLGGYGAGQSLYSLESLADSDGDHESRYIVFFPNRSYSSSIPPKVKLPVLGATEKHLTTVI